MALAFIRYAVLIVISIAAQTVLFAQEPNYVKTTVFDNPNGTEISKESIVYSDGLGREIQSKTVLKETYTKVTGTLVKDENGVTVNNAYDYPLNEIITATKYDDAGRPVKTYLPAPRNLNTTYNSEIFPYARLFYSNASIDRGGLAGEYPFSEVRYYDDPLGRIKEQGSAGFAYSIGRPNRTEYYYGSTTTASEFLTIEQLEAAKGDPNHVIPQPSGAKYYLSIVNHPNDSQYTQTITDLFGNTVSKWISPDPKGVNPIISTYRYDILGNLLEETPPLTKDNGGIESIKYQYNTLSQLIKKVAPDKGTITYVYDPAGRLTSSETNGKIVYYSYDALGRETTTYTKDAANNIFVKIRTVYDSPDAAANYMGSNDLKNLCNATKLTNTRGQVVASISYGEECGMVSSLENDPNCTERVVELYSYDDDGRVAAKYLSIPGLAVQRFEYNYSTYQGTLVQETAYPDGVKALTTKYYYDSDMQLQKIEKNGKKFEEFKYRANGSLMNKDQYKNDGTTRLAQTQYRYNQHNWLKSSVTTLKAGASSGTIAFSQQNYYEDASPLYHPYLNQYSGNIGVSTFTYRFDGNTINRYNTYKYDKADRLINVRSDEEELALPINKSTDADYTYDNLGRFVTKSEGNAQKNWGNYAYTTGTNKLDHIENSSRSASGTFLYDKFGNMIADKSKNMTIIYDWRDMPVQFNFYKSIAEVTYNSADNKLDNLPADANMVSYVKMIYDASGNRVLKQEFKRQ